MSKMKPIEMAKQIAEGLLSFPVTPFDQSNVFDEAAYRSHLEWLTQYECAGLFAAGGTGEFFSLSLSEYEKVVRTAVQHISGKVPVLAGAGYGTAVAVEFVTAAERAGADGILLLPPYLVNGPREGLTAHVRAVCAATRLGVILYGRDNAIYDPAQIEELCDTCPNLVGYKDGIGDIELMTRIHSRLGDRLTYIGGLPTAETFALPYLEMGVTTYSSAIFNFFPSFAVDFYQAVRSRDRDRIATELRDFVIPYIAIRDRRKGYAVSIVKAGMKAIGRDAGPVRPPLSDLTPSDFDDLLRLLNGYVTTRSRAEVQVA